MKKVRIRIQNETNSGHRIGWTKHVTNVDINKTNGYALEGNFLKNEQIIDIPVGAILVSQNPEGSVKRNDKSGTVKKVTEINGKPVLETILKIDDWYNDFLILRDKVAEELQIKIDIFKDFTNEQLIEECKKRTLI